MDHVYKDALVEKIVSYSKDGSPIYSKDLNVARQILMDKAKLCGLLKEQVEISGSVQTGLEETNDDDFETAFPPESELRS